MSSTRLFLATAICTSGLFAQTLVVPAVAAGADGNSSTSWPFDVATMHIQYIYDSSHFTGAGVNFPILINQIRYRANGSTTTTWSGSSGTLQVDLSTAPIDHQVITNTFASNHGPDQTTVYNGPFTLAAGSTTAGTPGPFYVTATFTQPFLYDPNAGDLTIDTNHSGVTIANTPALDCVTTTGVALTRRMQSTVAGATTGTIWAGELANVIEFTYTPAAGLYAGFAANVTAGAAPLSVNFTDQSFSSDPGGITTWAWDFDGDGNTDSTAQNPSYIYNGCGDFTVSLTVTDATHPANTLTRTAYVKTDEITAGFTSALLAPPNVFQLTDTTTPAATAWDWDFNGDGITDSTAQNPVVVVGMCQAASIRLLATRNCRTSTATASLFVAPNTFGTPFTGTNGLTNAVVMFDVNVTNPQGINICAMDHNTGTTAVGNPFTVDVYLTPGSYVGNDNNIAPWRLVTTGSGLAAGNGVPSTTAFAQPLYLTPGSHGVAIHYTNVSVRYTGTANGGPPVVYSNADMTLTLGAARSTLFAGGSFFSIREWNGNIHYDTVTTGGSAGYGFFGPGCPTSAALISGQSPTSLPTLGGTVTVDLTNLPVSAGIQILGFSNTVSAFGLLPLDLTGFQAPGCFGRVSVDATAFVLGAGGTATWSLGIPALPALAGTQFYTQCLVVDPTVNGLGAVVGDAYAGLIGN
ncbi:MAG: PKD domain-containing protein [Planctomycetes bacterium]|nr:PKD domain-containing protein [Planctomycetota bacterium]